MASEVLKQEELLAQEEELKFLGAQVDADLFWQFKETQAVRKETNKTALEHALRLYVDVEDNKNG